MDAKIFSEALRAVDEAINAETTRPAAPVAEPGVTPPIDVHISEMRDLQICHNAEIEAAQTKYADGVTASRAKLAAAQNELRAAERELAARWHGES